MGNLMRFVVLATLVAAVVVMIALGTTRSTRPVDSQDSVWPSVFKVGATIQIDFGSPAWHIEEIQGQWMRVTDASAEPQYTGSFWIDARTGKVWSVR